MAAIPRGEHGWTRPSEVMGATSQAKDFFDREPRKIHELFHFRLKFSTATRRKERKDKIQKKIEKEESGTFSFQNFSV
jgi:hypothetical protein